MRLIITENITLDGVIEATGGWFGPEGGGSDSSDIVAELQTMMRNEDGLLLGRVTFEEFRGYWPKQTNDSTGITDHLNRVPKYLRDADTGTDVLATHENVPPGIAPADNETGWKMALEKLAKLVEAGQRT